MVDDEWRILSKHNKNQPLHNRGKMHNYHDPGPSPRKQFESLPATPHLLNEQFQEPMRARSLLAGSFVMLKMDQKGELTKKLV
jgi:hypothetical protein